MECCRVSNTPIAEALAFLRADEWIQCWLTVHQYRPSAGGMRLSVGSAEAGARTPTIRSLLLSKRLFAELLFTELLTTIALLFLSLRTAIRYTHRCSFNDDWRPTEDGAVVRPPFYSLVLREGGVSVYLYLGGQPKPISEGGGESALNSYLKLPSQMNRILP